MTEAPERIWAKRTGEFLGAVEVGAWCDTVRQFDNPSEYILLSTHEAAVAAARKEGMLAARDIALADEANDWTDGVPRGGIIAEAIDDAISAEASK